MLEEASNLTTDVGNLTLSAAGNVLINIVDNSDITLPHGTGDVNLAGDTVVVGDSAAAAATTFVLVH